MSGFNFIRTIKKFFKENTIPKLCITAFWLFGFFYYITDGNQRIIASVLVCVFGWFLFYGIYMLCTSKKRKLRLVEESKTILRESDVLLQRMSSSTLLTSYLKDWDNLMAKLQNLQNIEKKARFNNTTTSALDHLRMEEQEQLKHAISRFGYFIKDRIRSGDTSAIAVFDAELRNAETRFDTETSIYAATIRAEIVSYTQVAGTIAEIDTMEGHAFEYWCADLLSKIGFTDVEVTRGSGDQGVDILAKKDGVKYAVQCKCYSTNLGNTPVQEVHAGLRMYGCQVGAVITNRYFTPGAKDLATATGVLLWDRDWISDSLAKSRL